MYYRTFRVQNFVNVSMQIYYMDLYDKKAIVEFSS